MDLHTLKSEILNGRITSAKDALEKYLVGGFFRDNEAAFKSGLCSLDNTFSERYEEARAEMQRLSNMSMQDVARLADAEHEDRAATERERLAKANDGFNKMKVMAQELRGLRPDGSTAWQLSQQLINYLVSWEVDYHRNSSAVKPPPVKPDPAIWLSQKISELSHKMAINSQAHAAEAAKHCALKKDRAAIMAITEQLK